MPHPLRSATRRTAASAEFFSFLRHMELLNLAKGCEESVTSSVSVGCFWRQCFWARTWMNINWKIINFRYIIWWDFVDFYNLTFGNSEKCGVTCSLLKIIYPLRILLDCKKSLNLCSLQYKLTWRRNEMNEYVN